MPSLPGIFERDAQELTACPVCGGHGLRVVHRRDLLLGVLTPPGTLRSRAPGPSVIHAPGVV